MKQSFRARRMARHHKRAKKQSKLNLVSLMDIFTILVFFLLVNSSNVEVLSKDDSIELPDSTADQEPGTHLTVTITADYVLVDGRPVAPIDDVMSSDAEQVAALAEELQYQHKRARPLPPELAQQGRPVTIMGHREIPYQVLKKIMTTCAANEYRNISLAVNKIAEESTPGSDNLNDNGVEG